MHDFKQPVKSDFCIKCFGCCRFREENSIWKPNGVILVKQEDYFICPHLNLKSNLCEIYTSRPFDCEIYPFLLHRQDGKLFLALHNQCVFIENEADTEEFKLRFKDTLDYFDREEVLLFLKSNQGLFINYHLEITLLKEIYFGHKAKTDSTPRKKQD
jgi:Fe-S-cluster containining protein